ncbi:Leucine-specific-binding protein [bacterium HR25]|jgi:branched-chain amino acid transport system substrate-binding protein|nr:Leucine-specific-binding protein [bacterium HR25]
MLLKRFFRVLGLAIVISLLGGIACGGGGEEGTPGAPGGRVQGAPAELRIGVVTLLSGPASGPFGIPARNAVEVWVDKINREGGIGGARIVPVITDEAGAADRVVAEFRRLVLDERVDAVIGYISSTNCLAVAPVAEELQVLTVLADCGTARVFEEARYKHVFRTHAHTVIDGVGAARYVLDLKPDLRTVAGINQDYAWGRDSWEVFIRALRQLKPDVQVVDELWTRLFAGEFSAEISKLQASRPDVIFNSFWGGDLITFFQQAEARGLTRQSLIVLNNTGTADLADVPEGVAIGSRGPHGIVTPDMADNPLRREFIELYKQRFGLAPNDYIPHGAYHFVQALQGLKAAYEKAIEQVDRWPTKDEVIKAFEYLEFDSPSGRIRMAIGGGHQAVEPVTYAVVRMDQRLGVKNFTNVKSYRAECVNPPDGVKTLEWIDRGFPGARC